LKYSREIVPKVVNKSLKEGKDKQLLNDEGSQTSDWIE